MFINAKLGKVCWIFPAGSGYHGTNLVLLLTTNSKDLAAGIHSKPKV